MWLFSSHPAEDTIEKKYENPAHYLAYLNHQEALTVATQKSQNLVPFLNAKHSSLKDETTIVHRLVDAPRLRELLEKPNYISSLERFLIIMAGIGNGINTLHNHGLIHRDINPSNILITTKPGKSEVITPKVFDYGSVGQPGVLDFNYLNSICTPHYAAPEQHVLDNSLGVTGLPTDVFLLGILGINLANNYLGLPGFTAPDMRGFYPPESHNTIGNQINAYPKELDPLKPVLICAT